MTPICERHAYSFTVDYISSGDADSITLHLSDAVEVWADDHKGTREPKGRVPLTLQDATADGFLDSLKVALSADVKDKKRSGTITMATLSPPYITMEECACLRDHYLGVIDVTLTPKGIKVRSTHLKINPTRNHPSQPQKPPKPILKALLAVVIFTTSLFFIQFKV